MHNVTTSNLKGEVALFRIFKKKSEVERLIEEQGFEGVASGLASAISDRLNSFGLDSFEIAYQFVLEELEAASMGSAEAKKFVRESGVPPSEYTGSLNSSRPEVDGPGGPQQTIISVCLQLKDKPDLMVDFRLAVLDKVMREFEFGKYESKDSIYDDREGALAAPTSRQAQIAAHVFDLAGSNLSLVGLEFRSDQAEEMIQSFADEIDKDVFERYDSKVAAMAVLLSFARNGVQFNELNAACMFSMSIIWASAKMTEERYRLSDKERDLVTSLREDALSILSSHRKAVTNLQAKLWIATTLSTELSR